MAYAVRITESRLHANVANCHTSGNPTASIKWEAAKAVSLAEQSATDVELTRFEWRRHRISHASQSNFADTTEPESEYPQIARA